MLIHWTPYLFASSILPLISSSLAFNGPQSSFVIQSTTVIDVLSADPDYESLLKLLQLARLIPAINRLNGSTMIAPTNDAISKRPFWKSALSDSIVLKDNVQEKLRQELSYHLLNYSLPRSLDKIDVQVHKTLLYPHRTVDTIPRQPIPEPPWAPFPNDTLGGQPQRLRTSSEKESMKAGVDAFGAGGVDVIKGRVDAVNGVVFGVGQVLEMPGDLASMLSHEASLAYLNGILKPGVLDFLANSSGLTLFLPVDSSWDGLDKIKRLYLESEFSSNEVLNILYMHSVRDEDVLWSDSFLSPLNVTTLYGTTLEITPSSAGHDVLVSSSALVHPDIYASNGVLHTISSLLIPPDALQLTPEKYLLALNCASFVAMLHSVNLSKLIDSTKHRYTILAPSDDVLELFSGDDFPEKGSESLKKLLQYHFVPGTWTPEKLKDGLLVETALEEKGLGGNRQVVEVQVDADTGKGKDNWTIRFGGVSVLGEHLIVNGTVIYFMSRPLTVPSDALATALPSLDFSSFLAAIFSTSLADRLRIEPRTTFFLPENEAFKRLGLLVSAHLLSASAKVDLEHVILHHAIHGVEYAASMRNGSQLSFPTLDGSDVSVQRSKNSTVIIGSSGGWAGMHGEITTHNMLTETGVIHEISDILIPRSVNLTIGKLMKAAKGNTMINLMARGGLDWILTGNAPPEDSPWGRDDYTDVGWTVLCPTDEAFKGLNMTHIYGDKEQLLSLLNQHLIPMSQAMMPSFKEIEYSRNKPLIMDDSASYSTLQSHASSYGEVVFRLSANEQEKSDVLLLGIKNARGTGAKGDWARVLSWGRGTTYGGRGGVIQIDQLLLPYHPSVWLEYGPPTVVGFIGIAIIVSFFLLIRFIWKRDSAEATYEPIGGFEEDN